MMNQHLPELNVKHATAQRLSKLGFNEAWLQKQIYRDASLLGLGELKVVGKEKIQPSGGRLDFLLADPENEIRYEVEVMLGAVDESHIIRTIEYWDIERQRYPHFQHIAVIVAEEITSRFFNVIRLLNRSVPIMALQLNAFRFENDVVLQFIRVLDTTSFGFGSDGPPSLPADRSDWEKKSGSLVALADAFEQMLSSDAKARVTYNRGHIALGTTGLNFCWLRPRKNPWDAVAAMKVGAEAREEIVDKLRDADLDARPWGKRGIRMNIKLSDLQKHSLSIQDVLRQADAWSRQ
ncbi:MAG: hypothetical protein M9932_00680 [Xanthobacteraceae bacterium]|nr:hypothetical protein [Xanthobacteraceae bacterium]